MQELFLQSVSPYAVSALCSLFAISAKCQSLCSRPYVVSALCSLFAAHLCHRHEFFASWCINAENLYYGAHALELVFGMPLIKYKQSITVFA